MHHHLLARISLGVLLTAPAGLFGCVGDEPSAGGGPDATAEAGEDAAPSSSGDAAGDAAPSDDAGTTPDAGLANGAACTSATACSSGFCVDGVCCNSACDGQCQACDITPGFCSQVQSGQPHGARAHCVGEGTTCAGTCGSSPTACTYPGANTQCQNQSCTAGIKTLAGGCDGHGACAPPQTASCGAFACQGAECFTACTGNDQCVPPAVCQCPDVACASKVCAGTKANGSTCTSNGDCKSGFCVDGVCCDKACTGQCEACDTTPGTCQPVTSGAPRGNRPACSGAGATCGGACAAGNTATCTYPDASKFCNSVCTNVTETDFYCTGTGACGTAGTNHTCANSLTCGATACKSSCSTSADCVSGNNCNQSSCTACGYHQGACCDRGQACNDSAYGCSSGTCQCGIVGGACCPGSFTCPTGYTCVGSGAGVCTACGALNQFCCDGQVCRAGTCTAGYCK